MRWWRWLRWMQQTRASCGIFLVISGYQAINARKEKAWPFVGSAYYTWCRWPEFLNAALRYVYCSYLLPVLHASIMHTSVVLYTYIYIHIYVASEALHQWLCTTVCACAPVYITFTMCVKYAVPVLPPVCVRHSVLLLFLLVKLYIQSLWDTQCISAVSEQCVGIFLLFFAALCFVFCGYYELTQIIRCPRALQSMSRNRHTHSILVIGSCCLRPLRTA